MTTANIGSAGVVRLRDGRSVTFVAAGPEDGFPVVYCHGAIGSPRWHTPGLDEVIERLGIRYLVVNRPGFAGSDPSPDRTVADFARDLDELMSALGYEPLLGGRRVGGRSLRARLRLGARRPASGRSRRSARSAPRRRRVRARASATASRWSRSAVPARRPAARRQLACCALRLRRQTCPRR